MEKRKRKKGRKEEKEGGRVREWIVVIIMEDGWMR